jgi:pimeloyl-ACP methyl ester carboxylesterase
MNMKAALLALCLGIQCAFAASPGSVTLNDAKLTDAARNREIRVRIYHPPVVTGSKLPVVIFSPGLGASSKSYAYWGQGLADQGFIVIHVDHPGSDAGLSLRELEKAGQDPAQYVARAQDISAIIDHLPQLAPDADPARVALAGHSLGALTSLLSAGAEFKRTAKFPPVVESRIQAFIVVSPLGAGKAAMGRLDENALKGISRPIFVVIGSKTQPPDGAPARGPQWVYDDLPSDGKKYLLWSEGATDLSFADVSSGGITGVHDTLIHDSALFLKTALLGDAGARAILLADLSIQK